MNVLVLLEESPERGPPADAGTPPAGAPSAAAAATTAQPLAHVDSVPPISPFDGGAREVVTLYGAADANALALALAAAVEGQRAGGDRWGAIRHLGVFAGQGAQGDAAWRDEATGQLMTQDLDIPLDALRDTARRLLGECGAVIRQMVAGLTMPDWPEGMRRAITFSFSPAWLAPTPAAAGIGADALLASLREADGNLFEGD